MLLHSTNPINLLEKLVHDRLALLVADEASSISDEGTDDTRGKTREEGLHTALLVDGLGAGHESLVLALRLHDGLHLQRGLRVRHRLLAHLHDDSLLSGVLSSSDNNDLSGLDALDHLRVIRAAAKKTKYSIGMKLESITDEIFQHSILKDRQPSCEAPSLLHPCSRESLLCAEFDCALKIVNASVVNG